VTEAEIEVEVDAEEDAEVNDGGNAEVEVGERDMAMVSIVALEEVPRSCLALKVESGGTH
jgi:hypothetical protein